MISMPQISGESFYLIAPILIFATLGFVSLVWGAGAPRAAARGSLWLGLLGALATFGFAVAQWGELDGGGQLLFSGMLSADRFSLFFSALTAGIVALALLLTRDYFEQEEIHVGEYYTLLFFSVVGILIMAMANDLMMMFVGVELMSLCAYVLTGFDRGRFTAIEGALKYFILGSFASGFLLFGIAFLYGATGTTSISEIGQLFRGVTSLSSALGRLRGPQLTPEVLPLGVGLVLIGLTFKIGAAPFHMWVPDVYQGAPAPVTAFMSTGIKAAAFATFVRILVQALPGLEEVWGPIIAVMAVLTMVVGNLAALAQRDVKRMLAYSSIAHGGYALMGFLAIDAVGKSVAVSSILMYLVAYAVMNIGAFAVIVQLQKKGESEVTDLDSFGGLGFRYPMMGAAMSLFMISLGGLPPTVGFIAKFNLFAAVVGAGYTWLVIIALLTSAASMYYYLRVVVFLYMRPELGGVTTRTSLLPTVVIAATAAAVMVIGLFPSSGPLQFLQWAHASVQALLA